MLHRGIASFCIVGLQPCCIVGIVCIVLYRGDRIVLHRGIALCNLHYCADSILRIPSCSIVRDSIVRSIVRIALCATKPDSRIRLDLAK